MAFELNAATIKSLVESFKVLETQKRIDPLTARKTKYDKTVSEYGTLSSKILAFKSSLDSLKITGSDSVFQTKTMSLADSTYFSATASPAASTGNYDLRINQIAKNDTVFSSTLLATTPNIIAGDHEFLVKTGDGLGGEYNSHVKVNFSGTETNQTIMEKIRDAVQADKAVVNSTMKTATDSYSGGSSTFKLTISKKEYLITISDATDYNDLMDKLVTEINKNSGVNAQKVDASGNLSLKVTASNNTDDLSITHVSGFDLVTDLNISADKEKSAAGTISTSIFRPSSTKNRFSLVAKNSGLDYRIKEVSDINGGTALAELGMNFGTSRTQYDQLNTPEGSGFLYSDDNSVTNVLNAKIELNGINITRNTNQITDLINGVTLNLKTVMKADVSAVNFSCTVDTAAVRTKLDTFITKFNELYSNNKMSELKNDSNLDAITNTLNSYALHPIAGIDTNKLNSLGKIGMSFSSSNGLTISDSEAFNKKLSENLSEVEPIFNSENGIATKLSPYLKSYIGFDGILNKNIKSFKTNSTYFDDKIKATQTKLDKEAEDLRIKYQKLQMQIDQLVSRPVMFT
ncbi:MAG: flagellar filament capping protein FliD [Syntrophothermus sp.]